MSYHVMSRQAMSHVTSHVSPLATSKPSTRAAPRPIPSHPIPSHHPILSNHVLSRHVTSRGAPSRHVMLRDPWPLPFLRGAWRSVWTDASALALPTSCGRSSSQTASKSAPRSSPLDPRTPCTTASSPPRRQPPRTRSSCAIVKTKNNRVRIGVQGGGKCCTP